MIRGPGDRRPGLAAADPWGDPGTGNNQWDMYQIHVPEAHTITTGSSDVVVGIIDTGIDYNHQDLNPNINFAKSVSCVSGAPVQDPAAWMDRNGHGTHTAGTVAAAKNGVGIVGIAPNVQLAAIKSAMNRGVTVVAAAGNDRYDLTHPTLDTVSPDDSIPITREVTNACLVIPAEIPGVITVSAVGYLSQKASYSNYGMGAIQVAAPGGDSAQRPPGLSGGIYSTYTRNRYARLNGTSMASPHVAGVAALVLSQYGKMPRGRLQAILTGTADPLSCPDSATTTCVGGGGGYTSYFGHGLVNAFKAVTHTTN